MNRGFSFYSSSLLLLVTTILSAIVSGCGPKPPCPTTPEEAAIYQCEKEQMVRGVLIDTTPRNLNNLPKAVPEFWTVLPGRRCPPPSQ